MFDVDKTYSRQWAREHTYELTYNIENGAITIGELLIISLDHIYREYVYLTFITNMYYGFNL